MLGSVGLVIENDTTNGGMTNSKYSLPCPTLPIVHLSLKFS